MEKEFINKSLMAATIVAVIFAPFLFVYFGASFSLGFMAGAAWNIVNVFLLHWSLRMALSPAAQDDNENGTNKKMVGTIAGVLKFPILYGAGYIIIKYTSLSLYGIIAGFSLILITFILRVSGTYFKNHALSCPVLKSVRKETGL